MSEGEGEGEGGESDDSDDEGKCTRDKCPFYEKNDL